MNKSEIFKAAHALTKLVNKAGDCYRVTFAAALRIVIAGSKYNFPANETRNKMVCLQALDSLFAFAVTKTKQSDANTAQKNAFEMYAQAMPAEFYASINLRTTDATAGRQVMAAITKAMGLTA